MNTQNFLHENSDKIPEGLYIDLMNKLKLDFDKNEKESEKITEVIVINKSVSKMIVMRKEEMIQRLISESFKWNNDFKVEFRTSIFSTEVTIYTFPEDREKFIIRITQNRGVLVDDLKKLLDQLKIGYMKLNPRWKPIPQDVHRLRMLNI